MSIVSARLAALQKLSTDPWYSRTYEELSPRGWAIAMKAIVEIGEVDDDVYARKVARYFLDKARPPKWVMIDEILMATMSSMKGERK